MSEFRETSEGVQIQCDNCECWEFEDLMWQCPECDDWICLDDEMIGCMVHDNKNGSVCADCCNDECSVCYCGDCDELWDDCECDDDDDDDEDDD